MALTNYPNGLTSFGVPLLGSSYPASYFGTQWFVDTVNGVDGNSGTGPNAAFATMGRALRLSDGTTNVGPNDTIYFVGKVREQLVAPLTKTVNGTAVAVTGVKIVGMAQGNVRDDDGAKWFAPASPTAGKALLEILQQGWEFHNFLMTPDTTSGACIKAHRNEDATYPDSSHFVCRGMRFVGTSLTTTYGIEDVGGNHHYLIDNCEFQALTTGIRCSSTAISVPLRNTISNCKFMGNTNDINSPQSYGLIQNNRFLNDSTITLVIAAGGNCTVTGNTFPNIAADIDIAHGYSGNSSDVWTGNLVTDQAAFVFGYATT